MLCKNGARYCRDQLWTGYEGLSTFTIASPAKLSNVKLQALTGADAGNSCGYVCNPDCFKQRRRRHGTSTVPSGSDAGGITVKSSSVTTDAGATLISDGGLLNDYTCIPGTLPDIDCDRIPDSFDTDSEGHPFQTDNKTIFMTLGPGQTAQQNLNVNFKVKSADIYFMLDMTGIMEDGLLHGAALRVSADHDVAHAQRLDRALDVSGACPVASFSKNSRCGLNTCC